MRHEKVRRPPVPNGKGKLQGILCLNDPVLRVEGASDLHDRGVSYEDVMSTLKAISEHRPHPAAAHAD